MIKKTLKRKNGEKPYVATDINGELAEITSLSQDSDLKALEKSPEADARDITSFADSSSPQAWEKKTVVGVLSYQNLLIGMVMGALLMLGANRFIFTPKTDSSVSSPPITTVDTPPAKSVTLAPVRLNPVQRTLKATGTVAAVEPIEVFSQATGLQIRQVLADEGDDIQAGQLLVLLDDAVQQAQLLQAQAEIAQAQARLDELKAGNRTETIAQAQEKIRRLRAEKEAAMAEWELAQMRVQRNTKLQEEGAIALDLLDGLKNAEKTKQAAINQVDANLAQAQQELQELENGARPEEIAQASAQLANAKARYQMMLAQVRDTKVTSPVSGKISQRQARVGNVTTSNQRLFTIIEDGRLELRLKVPETQLTGVRPGQTVTITSDADKNLVLTGQVREIEPRIDENSRQGIVRVDLGRQPSLKPGMFLRGAIVTETATSLTVPMAAVLPQPDGTGKVYVVQPDQTVKGKVVQLGAILDQGRVEILEGLTPRDQVVVKGAVYLNEGDRIAESQSN